MSDPRAVAEDLVWTRSVLGDFVAFLTESLSDSARWSDEELVRIRELLKNAQEALEP